MNKLCIYAMGIMLLVPSVKVDAMGIGFVVPGIFWAFQMMHTEDEFALYQACQQGQLSKVESLLARRVDVNKRNNDGITPLMAACGIGHAPIISALIASRAEVNLIDRDGDTALFHAIRSRSYAAVQTLCEQGHPDFSKCRVVPSLFAYEYSQAIMNFLATKEREFSEKAQRSHREIEEDAGGPERGAHGHRHDYHPYRRAAQEDESSDVEFLGERRARPAAAAAPEAQFVPADHAPMADEQRAGGQERLDAELARVLELSKQEYEQSQAYQSRRSSGERRARPAAAAAPETQFVPADHAPMADEQRAGGQERLDAELARVLELSKQEYEQSQAYQSRRSSGERRARPAAAAAPEAQFIPVHHATVAAEQGESEQEKFDAQMKLVLELSTYQY